MNNYLPLLLVVAYAICVNGEIESGRPSGEVCRESFGEWRPWTEQCLWLPVDEIRQSISDACGLDEDLSTLPTPEPFGQMPPRCGHCSFKFRCRTRNVTADSQCFKIDGEKQVCNEFGDQCIMPSISKHGIGCRWNLAAYFVRQCSSRVDISDDKRNGMNKLSAVMPNLNCKEDDGKCACCCHPYEPDNNGNCVEKIVPQCENWNEWNDWSECMWFPIEEMKGKFTRHCGMTRNQADENDDEAKKVETKIFDKLPSDFQIPSKCGYCSFKVKCRKRPIKDVNGRKTCFPLDTMKMACDSTDCDGCGDICTVAKLRGACNYTDQLRDLIEPMMEKRMTRLPYNMKEGLMKAMSNFPTAKCIEKDDMCKCCCHPYEPNQDGTACVISDVCKLPEDMPK